MVKQSRNNKPPDIITRFNKDLKGSLTTLLILLIIESENEVHGYKIKKLLKEVTKSDSMIPDSSLYTALRSLQSKYNLITSRNSEVRVYYSLTKSGSIVLANLQDYWTEIMTNTNTAIKLIKHKD